MNSRFQIIEKSLPDGIWLWNFCLVAGQGLPKRNCERLDRLSSTIHEVFFDHGSQDRYKRLLVRCLNAITAGIVKNARMEDSRRSRWTVYQGCRTEEGKRVRWREHRDENGYRTRRNTRTRKMWLEKGDGNTSRGEDVTRQEKGGKCDQRKEMKAW
jgi:hypothetical protein